MTSNFPKRIPVSVSARRVLCTVIYAAIITAFTPAVVLGQKTPAPFVLQQYLDGNGDPYSSAGMCVFAAGSSTLSSSYTTAAGSVANANPLMLDSAGRPNSNGFFLTPGVSYKLVLVNFTGISVPACSPINGVTVWTQDNILAVPGSSAVVDIDDAVAGESLSAGDAVYLSTGLGGLNAGQWYKTDADLTYKSTAAIMVGIVPTAIAAAARGSVRVYGQVTLTGPLNAGSAYYASATAGSITSTPPTNAIRIGSADSTTTLIVGYTKAPVSPRGPPCGRLTLTTGLPVTTADVTAATTVFYTPAGSCNTISLYDGTAWTEYALAEISIAVPATTNTGYDVFAYDNAGVVALELTAWSSLTARATALVLQNGVYAKTGVLTRRFLGSFRTTGVSGQTEDSVSKRYLSNYYNRAKRDLLRIDSTVSWPYSTATIRQANGSTANQVEIFNCLDNGLFLTLTAHGDNSSGVSFASGIGQDSTTTFLRSSMSSSAEIDSYTTSISITPAVGGHTYSWNEWSAAVATTTFYGTTPDGTPAGTVSMLVGWIEGD
jgi:hypothetical protein